MALRTGIAILCAAVGIPAPIAAATMKVTVEPTTVHRNETYTITITGRVRVRRDGETPHLLAFIQYTGAHCRRTATAEYGLPSSEWSWLFYPQRAEQGPRFKLVFYKRARTRFGERRVCAYLYRGTVTPATTGKPLVRAGAPFREVRS
jgi:hypothetical protein